MSVGIISNRQLFSRLLTLRASTPVSQLLFSTSSFSLASPLLHHRQAHSNSYDGIERVTVIGSGNWGSVAAKIIAQNISSGVVNGRQIDPSLRMWTFEEEIIHNGSKRKLTEVINSTHENVKYLNGISLGSNVVAVPNLIESVRGSTILVFVSPHQFIKSICNQLNSAHVITNPSNTKAISLIKGMEVHEHGFELISELIHSKLKIDCSVLMGANIANEVAKEEFSEATVGSHSLASGEFFRSLFHRPYFHVNSVQDPQGVELCGTLKNIVALGSGFVDGLSLGNNTKAAIIRIGLLEMIRLSQRIYPSIQQKTFLESCGIADLITTCSGGRNRKCAEHFAKNFPKKSFEELEKELLNGQKLQGVLTSNEVQMILKKKGWEKEFPLFTTINDIVHQRKAPNDITKLEPVR